MQQTSLSQDAIEIAKKAYAAKKVPAIELLRGVNAVESFEEQARLTFPNSEGGEFLNYMGLTTKESGSFFIQTSALLTDTVYTMCKNYAITVSAQTMVDYLLDAESGSPMPNRPEFSWFEFVPALQLTKDEKPIGPSHLGVLVGNFFSQEVFNTLLTRFPALKEGYKGYERILEPDTYTVQVYDTSFQIIFTCQYYASRRLWGFGVGYENICPSRRCSLENLGRSILIPCSACQGALTFWSSYISTLYALVVGQFREPEEVVLEEGETHLRGKGFREETYTISAPAHHSTKKKGGNSHKNTPVSEGLLQRVQKAQRKAVTYTIVNFDASLIAPSSQKEREDQKQSPWYQGKPVVPTSTMTIDPNAIVIVPVEVKGVTRTYRHPRYKNVLHQKHEIADYTLNVAMRLSTYRNRLSGHVIKRVTSKLHKEGRERCFH